MSETPRSEQPEQQETRERQPEIEIYSDKYEEEVKRLINDVYENEMKQHSESGRPDLDMIPEMYQKENENFWVAVDGERVVGTIALTDEKKKRAGMHRFCVDPKFRGTGLSDKLFSILRDFAGKKSYKKLFLSTWERAKAANNFYVKNGFKRIESLPQDMVSRSYFVHDKVFYELDLEQEK